MDMSDARTWTAAKVRLAALLIAGAALVLGPATSAEASGVTVTDLATSGTATTLAQSLAGGGVTVSNATFTGSTRAGGSFTGGTGNVGPASGVVLGSGKVQTKAGDTTCSSGVEGPNDCHENNAGGDNETSLGQPGDANLNTLSGQTTFDASILEFDFVPTTGIIQFSYVFGSEEYNDFVNSGVNDSFGFFINSTNCAVVSGTTTPVTIDTINLGAHPELFRNNVPADDVTPAPIDSELDGLTTVLTCSASVNSGVTNHAKLAIADAGDSIFDSGVFIQAGSLVSGNLLTVNKGGTGGGTVTSNPAGINCGIDCSETYTSGMVTLTATPDGISEFAGWSGACTNASGTCTVTMDQARSVTATFNALPTNTLTVTKNGTGTGTVTSSPSGINCGATCSSPFLTTANVSLTPTADAGSTFAGWSGDCTGSGACSVLMDQARSVTATFNLVPVTQPPVTQPPTAPTCDGKDATIVGTNGVDNLKGTKGADVIVSLGGNDKVNAKGGNDTVCGGDGKDHVVGGPGNDDEFGEGGSDHLIGNKGSDDLNGGPGNDKCLGGAGNNSESGCEK
jgi:Ca2+-binding RTX toxin-like protein